MLIPSACALSGDGGDEMFAGYDSYRGHLLSERLRRLPGFDTKLPHGRQKYLLRKTMERYFPAEFRQKLLAPGAMLGHLYKREALERVIGEHARLTRDWSFALWTLLMFETWCGRCQVGPDALAA